jgi:hypothetical protein
MEIAGAVCFGVVIGWITYRTVRRKEGPVGVSDIAGVIAAVGGAAVTTLFDDANVFGAYCIGLAAGFFGYLVISFLVSGKETTSAWMGD